MIKINLYLLKFTIYYIFDECSSQIIILISNEYIHHIIFRVLRFNNILNNVTHSYKSNKIILFINDSDIMAFTLY